MKVVFPCKGSLVLLKQDLETLSAFYNTSLLTSKMSEYYKTSNSMVQVGSFNYIPAHNSLVLYKANLLTIEKMRKLLGIYRETSQEGTTAQKNSTSLQNTNTDINRNPISDDDILSNSFFQTLKPI